MVKYVFDIPAELYKRLRHEALDDEQTLKEYLLNIIDDREV